MAVRATELRKGQVIQHEGQLLLITDYMHHTPGNLRAIIHIKTRNLTTGQTGQMRLGSSNSLEVAYLERKRAEYLYREASGHYVFMDSQNYEQFHVSDDLIGEHMGYVRENTSVDVTFHGTQPIGVELPASVVLTVQETEPAVRGNTATSVKKDAVLETGLKIKVPAHIAVGESIKVRTADGEFIGRASEG
jgi:elongation factor P